MAPKPKISSARKKRDELASSKFGVNLKAKGMKRPAAATASTTPATTPAEDADENVAPKRARRNTAKASAPALPKAEAAAGSSAPSLAAEASAPALPKAKAKAKGTPKAKETSQAQASGSAHTWMEPEVPTGPFENPLFLFGDY